MNNFYFISLLLLFVLVLGMCIPNLSNKSLLSEDFTVNDWGDYYNWGLKTPYGEHKQHKRKHHYPNRQGEYKCYYEPSKHENNYCKMAMIKCPLKTHPDLNNYVLKSKIPPQPNLNNYILKSNIRPAKCPDHQKCPPHPDMNTFKKYMKKLGKCPTCPKFKSKLLDISADPPKPIAISKHKKTNKVKPSLGYEYV